MPGRVRPGGNRVPGPMSDLVKLGALLGLEVKRFG